MTQAVELSDKLQSCGVSVRLDRGELVLRPGSKIPQGLLEEVRQHKPDLVSLLSSTWPPTDAEELIAAWEEIGCPEIPLSPGISVSNLRTWFHPVSPTEHMAGRMEAVRGFIYEGIPSHEGPAEFTIPGL
jgi:hypothetical protein